MEISLNVYFIILYCKKAEYISAEHSALYVDKLAHQCSNIYMQLIKALYRYLIIRNTATSTTLDGTLILFDISSIESLTNTIYSTSSTFFVNRSLFQMPTCFKEGGIFLFRNRLLVLPTPMTVME